MGREKNGELKEQHYLSNMLKVLRHGHVWKQVTTDDDNDVTADWIGRMNSEVYTAMLSGGSNLQVQKQPSIKHLV